jgi:hypothetical protein
LAHDFAPVSALAFSADPKVNSQIEPPPRVSYELEEALELLAALEDARDALAATDHLAVLAQVEHEIARLSRKLGLDKPPGGGDGR